MKSASEEKRGTIPPCSENHQDDRVLHRLGILDDRFVGRQLQIAGLESVAQKAAAGEELDLEDALVLSTASLPIVGRVVQLQAAARGSVGRLVAADLPIHRASSFYEGESIGQPVSDWSSFCEGLIEARKVISSGGTARFWYPIVERRLDQDGEHAGPSGVEVLRAIALARLVLPVQVEVQAPLATLGVKLAQVALEFGATHLGWVVPDGQTSEDSLIADARVLDETRGNFLPTALTEDIKGD
jgi:hypothetical protein